jgi:hypothetical protein
MAEAKNYRYWKTSNPPLLLQGFDIQSVVTFLDPEDRRQFVLEVNRGVVNAVDYVTANFAILTASGDETVWTDASITCLAGGQELIRNNLAERYGYNLDIGNQREQKILTWINGGQTIDSNLSIDPASVAPVNNIVAQFQAYYTTEQLEEWRRTFKWKNGLGLKRRTYRVPILAAQSGNFFIEDVLPKNQGEIVGFSMLYEGANILEAFAGLSVDGIALIKNVSCLRFSRFSQRDPYVFKIPLNPGSTFRLDLDCLNVTGNDGILYVTYYFDN